MQQNRDGELKLFKQFGRFSFLLILTNIYLFAGSFEDFKHSQADAFSKYLDKKDNEFKSYLESEWKEYQSSRAMPLYKSPKPKYITPTQASKIKSVGPKLTLRIKKDTKKYQEIFFKSKEKKEIEFDFFGTKLGFNIDKKIPKAKFYPQSQQGIKNFFDTMASSDYTYLLSDIQRVTKVMNLNDWGVYLLVNTIALQIYNNRDNSDLFDWFVLSKLGYLTKVGLSTRHVVLMHYSKKVIYAAPSFTFKGRKYYVLSEYSKKNIAPVYSYEQDYPDAYKPLDLSMESLPKFSQDIREKTLVFKQFGEEYRFHYRYNQNLIDFMATYPQADYETFFNAPLQEITYNSLASDFKKVINTYQASRAINFVLHFVQNAFLYQTDDRQFGKEKVMFAQETLYYEHSDCEDRAILFAYLIKKMFKIAIIGVKYSNHMATALYIPMSGDSVKVRGRRFVIADPTYVNANIGQSMPQFRSKRPDDFIFLNQTKITSRNSI